MAIARAFASDAALILADEPTAALDSEWGHHAVEMIRMEAHSRNKAAVMVPMMRGFWIWRTAYTGWKTES